MKARDSYADGLRFNASIARSIERYEGKMALMATWEAAHAGRDLGEEDLQYLQHLRKEATKLRAQLKVKGVYFGDGDDGN